MFSRALQDEAERLLAAYRAQAKRIVTVESCTGGLVAALLTEVAGSSEVLERGFVTYSNDAKTECVGVPAALIATHGAVSEAVARAMAEGALLHSRAQVAVSVTGVAGPGGGTASKPVGLVHLATAGAGRATLHRELRLGDVGRDAIRMRSVEAALALLREALGGAG
jgi:nicotinamide-nucleotide amidase